MTGPLFDLLLIALSGVQVLGLTFGVAALVTVSIATLLRGHTDRTYVLILADPIVHKPLMRAGIMLTGAGLAAYVALTVMVRWWPY